MNIIMILGILVLIEMVIDENFFEPKRHHNKYVEYKKREEQIAGVK